MRASEWFTLFFVPVFPYKIESYLICPICEYGFKLDGEKFEQLRPMAEANQLLINGKISESEHGKRMGLISSEGSKNEQIAESKEINTGERQVLHCYNCDKEINHNANFCKFCGEPLRK